MRAESFFNAATHVDEIGVAEFYGGKSLHERSHGESFFTLLDEKFRRNGLFLLDEPEAALSPQRQLAFLILIHDVLRRYKDAQFVISSHSPILLGYPDAQILSFDGERIREITYEDLKPVQIVRRFVNDRNSFLQQLIKATPSLFDDGTK